MRGLALLDEPEAVCGLGEELLHIELHVGHVKRQTPGRCDDVVIHRYQPMRIEHPAKRRQGYGEPMADPAGVAALRPQHVTQLFPGDRATPPGGENPQQLPCLARPPTRRRHLDAVDRHREPSERTDPDRRTGPPVPHLGGATEVPGGYAGNWRLWVYAVCADPLSGYELVWSDAVPADSDSDAVTVGCRTNKRVHGVGSYLSATLGEVRHHRVIPSSTLTTATVYAVEDTDGAAHDWWTRSPPPARVYAIRAY